MKYLFFAALLFVFTGSTCHKTTSTATANTKQAGNCFKARLEIKGICMNYVIKVLEGDTSKLHIEQQWKDETDGKAYTNVFALGSRCSFPDLAEGETFYFTVMQADDAHCNVCLAYRPVPAAKNNIIVTNEPCP